MPPRHYCRSSSSAYSSSPSKSPPMRSSRRRRLAEELSSTLSSTESSSSPVKRRAKKPRSQKSPPGTEKGAEKVGLEKKLHSILLCTHEKTEAQLLTSLKGKKLMRYSRAIGQLPNPAEYFASAKKDSIKAKKLPELQSLGFSVLRALERFIRLLHRKKYTFGGQLDFKMLYWIPSSKSVKLHKDCIPHLTSYSDEGAKMDYHAMGVSIRDDLFGANGLNPPSDVLAWINLMLDDPLKNKYLLRYNVALLHRRAKLDVFSSCYEKLLQLKELVKLDKSKEPQYDKVIDNIVGSDPTYVWMEYTYLNTYVQLVYERNREGRGDTVFELLRFVRDCIHHLMEYSVEKGIVMFTGDDKYSMIESCFPEVIHKFQKAMADAGMKEGEHGTGM